MEHYEYDAFISYKHAKFDTEICRALHKQLESYKIVKSGKKHKVKRVFLDTEELASSGSLSRSIQEALERSRYLIVVCSRETPSSPWVGREIEYFISKRGYQNVLALLIDGEPSEAFPEQLRFVDIDGILNEIEPLAADIRADNPKQSKKALKHEILRLLAPLLGMTYDDLRQRHQKRVIRRAIRTSLLTAAVFLLFGAYAGTQWFNIYRKNLTIEEQSGQIKAQNDVLEENNRVIKEQNNHVLSLQSRYMAKEANLLLEKGDRRLALFLARHAMPGSLANPDKPYTEEAEYALLKSLGAYYYPYGYFDKDTVFTHDSNVQNHCLSRDGKLLAAVTKTRVSVWEIETGEKLYDIPFSSGGNDYGNIFFSADGKVFYTNLISGHLCAVNAETGGIIWENADVLYFDVDDKAEACVGSVSGGACMVDLKSGEVIKELPFEDYYPKVRISPDGRYAALSDYSRLEIIDIASDKTVAAEETENYTEFYFNHDVCLILITEDFAGKERYIFYDLKDGRKIDEFTQTAFFRGLYLLDGNKMLIVYNNSFEIYDFAARTTAYNTQTYDIDSCVLLNDLLFLTLKSQEAQIYDISDGTLYETFTFDCADGIEKSAVESGVFAGRRKSEVFIYRRFNTPDLIEFENNIVWAAFVSKNRLLCRIYDDSDHMFALVNADNGEIISSVKTAGWIGNDSFAYEPESGLLYYIDNDKTFNVAKVSENALSREKSVPGEMNYVTVTDGIPVLIGYNKAVMITPEGDVELALSLSASNAYKRDDLWVFTGYSQLEIIKNGESAVKTSANVYAFDIEKEIYVYFENGGLIFQSFFDGEIVRTDVLDLGNIVSLFFSPDGERLFIATDTRRLFVMNVNTKEIFAADADFYGIPQEAFYINEVLTIRDSMDSYTFWNEKNMKLIGRTDSVVVGYGYNKLALSNGYNAGVVPFYTAEELMRLADEILLEKTFSESDKALYFIE